MRKVSKFSEEEKEKSSNMIIKTERHKNLPEDEKQKLVEYTKENLIIGKTLSRD